MSAALSIVVPAHDEGGLIRESLLRMLDGTAPGEFEVVVVANGCSDDTAARARSVDGVTVVEIGAASKIAALNEGDRVATAFPRLYVDADVSLTSDAIRRTGQALEAARAPRVAAPELAVDATASTMPVRCHARVWALSDYRRSGHVGSGVYAVNEAGRRRWGRFPEVIADDRLVQTRFSPAERIVVPGASFTVRAPATMRALVRRGIRIQRGNRQLPDSSGRPASTAALLRRVARTPSLWLSFPFYAWGHLVPKLRARGGEADVSWARDPTFRTVSRA